MRLVREQSRLKGMGKKERERGEDGMHGNQKRREGGRKENRMREIKKVEKRMRSEKEWE